MNKPFELFPGAKLGVARVRPICAGVRAPTSHTNEVEVFAAAGSRPGAMKKLSSFLLCATFTLGITAANLTAAAPLATVNLGSAATFAVLAGTSVTTANASIITGDLGDLAGNTGFPPGVVNGTLHDNDTAAQLAQAALGSAIVDAAGRTAHSQPRTQICAG